MSKLLAMMMKPKNYMYATIKGSLTENNGVFSDFSDTNYLALQKPFNANDYSSWEIVIKVNSGSSVGAKYFVGYLGYGFVLGTTMANSIRHFKAFFSSNGSSWDIGNIQCVDRVIANTDYYVKVGFNGTKYYIEQSTDGINYIGRNELLSSTKIISGDLLIGNGYNINNFWNGSIYNNQSYIKINNTKYNLQAVVGYTVVGTPTITDGVVSGFSDSDYLKTNNNFSPTNTFEIVCKFTTGTITTSIRRGIFTSLGTTDSIAPFYIYDGKLVSYLSSNGTSWDIINQNTVIMSLSSNTTYILKMEFTGTEYKWYSYENNNWVLKYTLSSSSKILGGIPLVFGNNRGTGFAFNGSIDMNETYIKIDGKLWFNGQPAE